jgi:hypothetical protein
VYDAAAGTFDQIASMTTARTGRKAKLLDGGWMLISGGNAANNSEVFDPLKVTWSSVQPTPHYDFCPLAGPPYSTAIQLANSRSLLFGLDAAGPFLSYTDHVVPLENIEFIRRATDDLSKELITMIRTVPGSPSANFQERNRSPLFFPDVVPTDNCTPTGSLTITQIPAAGTMVGLGTHTITVTAEDAAGNVGTSSTFAVIDITSTPMTRLVPMKKANASA